MKFKTNQEEKEITLRDWNGAGYGPDMFNDMEINFPCDHKREEGSEAYICTQEEYEELRDWWTEEVKRMNEGDIGQNGADYSEQSKDLYLFTA